MAEPSRCPYCRIGIPMWILVEDDNSYVLRCSCCNATGHYGLQSSQSDAQREGSDFDEACARHAMTGE